MKKKMMFVFALATTFLLSACQPKEEPKELALMAFDNALKWEGVNVSSKGSFDLDLSKAGFTVEEDGEEVVKVAEKLKGFRYTSESAFDKKGKRAEETANVMVPWGGQTLTFGFSALADENKNTLTLDNDKFVQAFASLWDAWKEELVALLYLGEADSAIIDDALAFTKNTLKNSYTEFGGESMHLEGMTEALAEGANELRPLLERLPDEAFTYEKDKKGAYGHIVITLDNKSFQQVVKKELEYSYKQSLKEAADEEEKEWAKEVYEANLADYEAMKEKWAVNKLSVHLFVNDDKQIEKWSATVTFVFKEGKDTDKQETYRLSHESTFQNVNKPVFQLPEKGKKIWTLEALEEAFSEKILEWDAIAEEDYLDEMEDME